MQRSSNAKTGNDLLDAMPPGSVERLTPHLEPFALVLTKPVDPVEHVYFPVAGMISVVATMANGAAIEVGMIGREGMYSVSAILSDNLPFQSAMVQLPGHALRLRTRLLRQEMQAEAVLQKRLPRYTQATLNAVAQLAACNRLHLLEQRFARWLLTFHYRAAVFTLPVPRDFLSL